MIVENKLLILLKSNKLDLIKFLMWNRFKIVWCTRLARSQDQEEREKMKGLDLQPILEELHGGRASANKGNRNYKSIREEATSRGKEKARRNVMLDLYRPTFAHNGFSMAKKEYKLHDECYRNLFDEYEEIHVALMAKPIGHPEVVKVCNMPA